MNLKKNSMLFPIMIKQKAKRSTAWLFIMPCKRHLGEYRPDKPSANILVGLSQAWCRGTY